MTHLKDMGKARGLLGVLFVPSLGKPGSLALAAALTL